MNERVSNFDDFDFGDYSKYVQIIGALSKLYSSSSTPLIHYRFVENLFTSLSKGENIASEDNSFDAITLKKSPVGVKTFVIPKFNTTIKSEKIAEFKELFKQSIRGLTLEEQVKKIAEGRNSRVLSDAKEKGVVLNDAYYHCLVRHDGGAFIHHEPYNLINIDKIEPTSSNGSPLKKFTGLYFKDDKNTYIFNQSKSTLFKRFNLLEGVNSTTIKIEILDDPLKRLELLLQKPEILLPIQEPKNIEVDKLAFEDFVILPLYSVRSGLKIVYERSGINQWNAKGRPRNDKEVYIQIPKEVRRNLNNFFPERGEVFDLKLPNNKVIKAKVCQQDGKALMSNPNTDLGNYIFSVIDATDSHGVNGNPFTYEDLKLIGKDSIKIIKYDDKYELVSFCELGAYEDFIQDIEI